ncbi:MAG: ABC transporter permease [Acidimicrobiales bacterium]|nr:MAG: ABC transporter permease [Acidimicrobiales bacterium]
MSTDVAVIRAIVARDLRAVRRSKAVVIPMLTVPVLLMVVLPLVVGFAARRASRAESPDIRILENLPARLAEPINALPPEEQLLTLVLGFLLAPLFLIVPLMVSAVLAADAFAGEKERRTMETLLHLPVSDRDLFIGKFLTGFLPAVAVSWIGFACFCVVANLVSWGIVDGFIVPNGLWLVMIFWVAPAVATFGLGVMVRVSARCRTTQEANQLGGAVILPLVFVAVGQSTGILLLDLPLAFAIGAVIWVIALTLVWRGAVRFTRDRVAGTA